MNKTINIILVLFIGIFLSPLLLLICLLVKLSSPGPILYWSSRIGRRGGKFNMPKFRTMHVETPTVATHLLNEPVRWLTPIGAFLRNTSLDELPQLWSILRCDMGFVGPRPALFNQYDLIALREENGVHKLLPGLTGWAQVSGRDMLSITRKVQLDVEYLHKRSLLFDLKILWMTALKVLMRDGVSH